ncbi:hypothetical protein EJ03DRAFT_160101 [Teratosphaeria nubilosa]|uniref:Uncharacterized protein n=1 Tax=Teratosphaeria nubilosa TaxID=161662 RepID=A0A6G1L2V5_9PEZI|nr:hypothetical protein EJ03DRAFT_160101 [Teratosphaeria nubilosa]
MSAEKRPKTKAQQPPHPHQAPTFSVGTVAGRGRENEPWIIKRSVNRTWIEYNATQDEAALRSRVRKHAAVASAATRKATIAKNQAARKALQSEQLYRGQVQSAVVQQRGRKVDAGDKYAAQKSEAALDVLRKVGGRAISSQQGPGLAQLMDFINLLEEGRDWYSGGVTASTLARKAINTILWDSYANFDTLFQAALFVSGTNSNTCGLPVTVTHHKGSGLLMLRGASLKAINAAVVQSDGQGSMESTPIAIALLAGWERRFGDRESFDVHMSAWRRMKLPSKALEENNVSTLTDVTLEIFREKLDERSFVSPSEIKVRPQQYATTTRKLTSLPIGFKVFNTGRPETRSVLMLVAAMPADKPTDPKSINAKRKLGMEIIAWHPCHTQSCTTVPSIEEAYDQLELIALYHVRAALISINGALLQHCYDLQKYPTTFDMYLALDVHCMSCQHLNTESLLGTKFEEVAFWTRYTLCAISRDPDRDEYIRYLMVRLRMDSWEKVNTVLNRHMDVEPVFGWVAEQFYRVLTANKKHVVGRQVGLQ